MSTEIESFISFIEIAKRDLNIGRQGAIILECSESVLDTFDKVISLTSKLEIKAKEGEIKINYLNQFQTNLESIISTLPFRGQSNLSYIEHQNEQWKSQMKSNIEQNSKNVFTLYEQTEFNIYFFDKIGYFENNIVVY